MQSKLRTSKNPKKYHDKISSVASGKHITHRDTYTELTLMYERHHGMMGEILLDKLLW
jgi:hypothetical protein